MSRPVDPDSAPVVPTTGGKLKDALVGKGDWTIEIVRRSNAAEGFNVLARRWVE